MKKTIIIILTIIILVAVLLDLKADKFFQKTIENKIQVSTTTAVTQTPELTEDDYIDISIYVQDKDVARTRDCRVTTKIEYTILKTSAIADASLKILFSDELKKYGFYKSISIESGVAKIMLASDMTPEQKPIGSLSSCESGHLLSVLRDTLVQYESIKSVRLFSSKGEIIF